MDTSTGLLAVIPALSSEENISKRFLTTVGGVPLIQHTIDFAKSRDEISQLVLVTDMKDVEKFAQEKGIPVMFKTDVETQTERPHWPLMRRVLDQVEAERGELVRFLVVLDPAVSQRGAYSVYECFQRLMIDGDMTGIVAPNGSIYMWRADFMRANPGGWRENPYLSSYESFEDKNGVSI